jgi:hypothetical protein
MAMFPASFDKTTSTNGDTAIGATDAERANALLLAGTSQVGLAYGMHVIGRGSSVVHALRKTLCLQIETRSRTRAHR